MLKVPFTISQGNLLDADNTLLARCNGNDVAEDLHGMSKLLHELAVMIHWSGGDEFTLSTGADAVDTLNDPIDRAKELCR